MSIVGPRPEDPGFVELAQDEYAVIHTVRPGITGLSQLACAEERSIGDDDSPITDYTSRILPQKLKLDQLYATTHSLKLDLSIIRWSLATVLFGVPVAVSRATDGMNRRGRPARVPATHETALTGSPVASRGSDG
jgi:lipopolysaccharide/colanic/teichoic acid biosynthesis glycosyltransferase